MHTRKKPFSLKKFSMPSTSHYRLPGFVDCQGTVKSLFKSLIEWEELFPLLWHPNSQFLANFRWLNNTCNLQRRLLHNERTAGHRISKPFQLYCVNDPSAGSPTETLLRLLLPLSDKVHKTFRDAPQRTAARSVRIIHRITQSVGATGGVYKGQGRNRHELLTRAY